MKTSSDTFKRIMLFSIFLVGGVIFSSCTKDEVDTMDDDPSNSCTGFFTDPRDGQTYAIVQIGEQCFFAENLRYSGNFPNVTDNDKWTSLTTPAWCYYENNPSNDTLLGKLYNWYAVETDSLCPPGWHVPSEDEWKVLKDYLGINSGGKLKSTSGWNHPNEGATNESGFSGLPGGCNRPSGGFAYAGRSGYWWSSTNHSTYFVWSLSLHYKRGHAGITDAIKNYGFSCRCLKD